jgi:hypothetical protein
MIHQRSGDRSHSFTRVTDTILGESLNKHELTRVEV